MPIYEYRCTQGHLFEELVSREHSNTQRCPECGCPGKKLFSAPQFRFKGTGFYTTDYRKGGK